MFAGTSGFAVFRFSTRSTVFSPISRTSCLYADAERLLIYCGVSVTSRKAARRVSSEIIPSFPLSVLTSHCGSSCVPANPSTTYLPTTSPTLNCWSILFCPSSLFDLSLLHLRDGICPLRASGWQSFPLLSEKPLCYLPTRPQAQGSASLAVVRLER